MIAILSHESVSHSRIPEGWTDWIESVEQGLRVVGDNTGATQMFIHVDAQTVTLSPDMGDLLVALKGRAWNPSISPAAISHLLHDGLVPAPNTIFKDIYVLGFGDTATLCSRAGHIQLRLGFEFPYLQESSRGDSEPNSKHLLKLLTGAVARKMGVKRDGVLMLSSGKDSSSIALALSHAGYHDVVARTYVAGAAQDEDVYARELCRRLGLKHEIVSPQTFGGSVRDELQGFFASSPLPSVDPAQIAYLLCLADVTPGSIVLDGSFCDTYMGYLPTRMHSLKSRLGLGGLRIADTIKQCVSHVSTVNAPLRIRAEASLFGRYWLRYCDSRTFYPETINTSEYWRQICSEYGRLDAIDFRSCVRGRHFEHGAAMHKARVAAAYYGHYAKFPFCDAPLIDYYFNLPEHERFDRKTLVNKLLLRKMLREFLDYDDFRVGKLGFTFNSVSFLLKNSEFVLEEIAQCKLWNANATPLVRKWLADLEGNQRLAAGLRALFMISGWLNHCQYLHEPATVRVAQTSEGQSNVSSEIPYTPKKTRIEASG